MAALAVTASACFEPRFRADDAGAIDALTVPTALFERDAGPGPGAPTCPPDPSSRRLTFVVSTSPVGGRFAPRNVGVIWIEGESGELVRTLELWGGMRAKWLTAWQAVSSGNVVDAVTGATLDGHLTHVAEWDLKDVHACVVPDGPYVLRVELTDRSGTGVAVAIPFEKSTARFTAMPTDTATFQGMSLILE